MTLQDVWQTLSAFFGMIWDWISKIAYYIYTELGIPLPDVPGFEHVWGFIVVVTFVRLVLCIEDTWLNKWTGQDLVHYLRTGEKPNYEYPPGLFDFVRKWWANSEPYDHIEEKTLEEIKQERRRSKEKANKSA